MIPDVPALDPMLLPGFRAWKQPLWTTVDLLDYQYAMGSLDLAAAWCTLVWPQITVVDGCYLRVGSGATFPHHPAMTRAEQQRFESVSNHLHLYDVVREVDPAMPLAVYEYLATVLLHTWRAAAQAQHPGVPFTFSYATEPDDYGPTITFWHTEAAAE